jgi:hypothetical protein
MSVAVWSGSTLGWAQELSALKGRLAGVFRRPEVRRCAGAFIDGLLSGISRKTGWLLAEQAGLDRPYRMNHCSDAVVGTRMRCGMWYAPR